MACECLLFQSSNCTCSTDLCTAPQMRPGTSTTATQHSSTLVVFPTSSQKATS